jgi:ATP adenylyltransferase
MAYVGRKPTRGCIFCGRQDHKRDVENLILDRGKQAFVMMNRFPYNSGHLMVAPFRHVAAIERMTPAEQAELSALVQKSVVILKRAFSPEGFNIGMNLGRVAGAGVEHHLHVHVVPRWNGDTNFMPVSAETKVISEALAQTYKRLRPEFQVSRRKPARDRQRRGLETSPTMLRLPAAVGKQGHHPKRVASLFSRRLT